jgi:hypothetical protein
VTVEERPEQMHNELDVWGVRDNPRGVRLFVSHVHTERQLAGDLKRDLHRYGASAFVAHDDIEPSRPWEDHIIAALLGTPSAS